MLWRRRMLLGVDGGCSVRRGLLFRSKSRDRDGAQLPLKLFGVETSAGVLGISAHRPTIESESFGCAALLVPSPAYPELEGKAKRIGVEEHLAAWSYERGGSNT